ncbi:MAG: ECF RNA polymerase sigma factor SigL [Planctomycetes bacterium ADurb.Bin126]|nr:MAG: ECF RNA polymerase sigma factor SigL [Planctomycetes bacterium ADurb.Bin126]HOD84078.1 sigma-70 family RNA polymerase sigma factor [Phycisphaerae bacterium]HQL73216.1 sigma-70 family RNA polymerase sigma factor [Phycisphaerae bacterium]
MTELSFANLGRWYDELGSSLALYARQVGDAHEAEDVVQEVFLRLMAQRRPPRDVKAWLFRAVRNEAISRGRSRRRRELRERRQAAGRVELFEPRADDLIDARSAQAALERLDADQRELVVLRIWADMTLDQIARTTGLSVATVFRRYRAALAAIRKEMQPCTKTTT